MFSKDPTYPLFPIFAFLGFVLSLVPLPWHLQAWNSGTCAFMIWTAVACLVSFVNSLIWNNSLANVAPVWCDIATQLVLASGVGLPAATLCISRRLYKITSVQTVSITRDDKRRAIYVDLAIALGIPILVLLLHMIVQPHRFNIFEGVGCVPVTYNTLPAYFLFYMWPILLGLISLTYSSMTLRSFYMRRLQFNQLTRANSALNPSRYFRLMLLAIIDILCTIPLGVYTIYTSLHGLPLAPWISWDDTHFDFGRIVQYPTLIWRNTPGLSSAIEVNRWLPVACAFAFFIIFGFAEEARKSYRRAFLFVGKPFGYAPKKKLTIPPFKPGSPKDGIKGQRDPSKDTLPTFGAGVRKGDIELGLNTFMEKTKDFHFPSTQSCSSPSSSAPPAYTRTVHGSSSRTSLSDTIAVSPSSPHGSFAVLPDTPYGNHRSHTPLTTDTIRTPRTPDTPYTPNTNTFSVYSNASVSSFSSHDSHDDHHISISDAYPASRPSSRLPSIIIIGRPDADVDSDDSSSTYSGHSAHTTNSHSIYYSAPDLTTAQPTTRAPTPMPSMPSMPQLDSPTFRRPFTGPSILPVIRPHAGNVESGSLRSGSSRSGIEITIETHTTP